MRKSFLFKRLCYAILKYCVKQGRPCFRLFNWTADAHDVKARDWNRTRFLLNTEPLFRLLHSPPGATGEKCRSYPKKFFKNVFCFSFYGKNFLITDTQKNSSGIFILHSLENKKKTVARQFFSLGNRIVCNWLTSITGSPYSFASLRFRSFAFYTRLSNEQISLLPYSVL